MSAGMADANLAPDQDLKLRDDMEGLDEYELERQANIKNNAALLASLGLSLPSLPGTSFPRARPNDPKPHRHKLSPEEERARREARARAAEKKDRMREEWGTRRSGRVAAMNRPSTRSTNTSTDPSHSVSPPRTRPDPIPKSRAPIIPPGPTYDDPTSSSSSIPSSADSEPQPIPSRDADGTLVFEGRWKGVFTPNVTPQEMFEGGAFGGGFFADTYSNLLRAPLLSSTALASLPFPLPSSPSTHLTNPNPEGSINRFGVRAGQSLAEWEKAGWVWEGDPRGWAEWYVRFWGGRRGVDDERQVRRWLKVAGPTGRFKRALLKKLHASGGVSAVADEDVGRVLRQCLWQWGYELRETEYERAMEGDG
ncbi:hypothetical protein JCM24511_06043 [Saitozyma sp. JCM 24511]|nr:hypothetical protein JCM24511_06043 [Saitozyma sp. JCM 24511]